ncbi:MAG: hypothetical protein JSW00_08805 [Thermoplasmata archaeon]|nr:MAG: hypothetical protein JSW00_08805 [Thermoplasmata archaeon]
MGNITLSLPEDVHEIVRAHKEIRWSEIARRAISEYAKKLELLDTIASKSKLTEKDVKEIDKVLKRAIAKRHGI